MANPVRQSRHAAHATAVFDVINVAFATPTVSHGSTMQFAPDPAIYPDAGEFRAEIEALQREGKRILISISGASDPIVVDDSTDVAAFVASMQEILQTYGFDGVDIDLEGTSLYLVPGDDDFRNPTSPRILRFIEAIRSLMTLFPDRLLSAAPETACVQGGYQSYGGIWRAYLALLHALRDRIACVRVQHYNTGSMFGRDGNIYDPATADFHVAMADVLLAGFPVDRWGNAIYFDPLCQSQVTVGLPAGPSAGSGYTPPDIVHQALDYLILATPFGGQYELAQPDGYPGFRGLMTWSINWDVYYECEFSTSHREYLDSLPTSSVPVADRSGFSRVFLSHRCAPNPAGATTVLRYELGRGAPIGIELFDLQGRMVWRKEARWRDVGTHALRLDLSGLPSGIYPYGLRAADREVRGRICLHP
ncbi:MAG: chitinase [Candidatus Eisenbacteria bacterium]|nr:chitinase [Candidatus Eisenbacteria bacterium]